MKKKVFLLIMVANASFAQVYNSASIFAHNDYVTTVPFYVAYNEGVGFIEADVFLRDNELVVAHTEKEIDKTKTIELLYLKPLLEQVEKNNGFIYKDHEKDLTLMIDLKTEGVSTLNQLVKKLKEYPQLLACKTLRVAVSGNMPEPSRWNEFPDFIYFDGRPGIAYTSEQLKRVRIISTSFQSISKWNGKGLIPQREREALLAIVNEAHSKGKQIRFWAIPDFGNAWLALMDLKVDILNTDHVTTLSKFLTDLPKNYFKNESVHSVYQPLYNYSKTSSPKNIILLIGDGMSLVQIYSAYTANNGHLNLFNIKSVGFSITASADSYITDSAGGATAMAAGKKTNNRYVGVDSVGKRLTTLAEIVKDNGFKVSIISNGDITDATPASFYAHQPERSMSEAIALDFLSSKADILIGGGENAFKSRKDNRNVFTELKKNGYTIAESFENMDTIRNKRFVVLDSKAVVSKQKGRGDFLSRSLKKSLTTFTTDSKPFFIMEEGAQIDHGGHNNDLTYVIKETLDFDQAVGEALKFVDQNKETLLIITADHETGGLTLTGGNVSQGTVIGNFSTGDHTAVPVPVFAYGPGAEAFSGVYENTAIFDKILNALNLKSKK